MSIRRIAIVIAATVTLGLALSACSQDGGGGATSETPGSGCTPAHANLKTVKEGVLTVNAYVSPPYTVQKGGTIVGIDGLIVKKIASMECLTLNIQSVAGAALPSTIESGRADIAVGGVYASADRAKTFSLTIPMYVDRAALLSTDGVDSIEGLSGKSVGVVQGYLWNADFQKALGADDVKIYQTSASLISDIKNGRVDAGVFTSAEAAIRAQEDHSLKAALLEATPKIPASEKPNDVVLLLGKGATALTEAINKDLKTLLADGSVANALKSNGLDPSLAATH